MAIKKTIAIIGATEKTGREIANRFAFTDYRLLLVSNDIPQLTPLLESIKSKKPKAEIDILECVKDGCWEADVIILAIPSEVESSVAEMMKEVATQKIVVSFSNRKEAEKELQQVLPYSKVVKASDVLESKEILISGDDTAACNEIWKIFTEAEYRAKVMEAIPQQNNVTI
ncbi:MAG: NAD(P)-binding domain-containing protein [Ginsengibacter sp.]